MKKLNTGNSRKRRQNAIRSSAFTLHAFGTIGNRCMALLPLVLSITLGATAFTSAANALQVTAEQVQAKPLQFVLLIGMLNKPGDKHNSTCYSNVITRSGPPGWGAAGFLPSGSAEQARTQIIELKPAFIAACRRSGREIISEGSFDYVTNERDDGARVQLTLPRFAEDVSVVLN